MTQKQGRIVVKGLQRGARDVITRNEENYILRITAEKLFHFWLKSMVAVLSCRADLCVDAVKSG